MNKSSTTTTTTTTNVRYNSSPYQVKVVVNGSYGGYGFNDLGYTIFNELGISEPLHLERHDPMLIMVVEKIGNLISGSGCDFYIETIKGNEYRISEYDSYETIIVPKNDNYIKVQSNELNINNKMLNKILTIISDSKNGNDNSNDEDLW